METRMTRQEHIQWCKDRAKAEIEYYKSAREGLTSMASDLSKHEETNNQTLINLCMMQLLISPNMTIQQAIKFIDGFN